VRKNLIPFLILVFSFLSIGAAVLVVVASEPTWLGKWHVLVAGSAAFFAGMAVTSSVGVSTYYLYYQLERALDLYELDRVSRLHGTLTHLHTICEATIPHLKRLENLAVSYGEDSEMDSIYRDLRQKLRSSSEAWPQAFLILNAKRVGLRTYEKQIVDKLVGTLMQVQEALEKPVDSANGERLAACDVRVINGALATLEPQFDNLSNLLRYWEGR